MESQYRLTLLRVFFVVNTDEKIQDRKWGEANYYGNECQR